MKCMCMCVWLVHWCVCVVCGQCIRVSVCVCRQVDVHAPRACVCVLWHGQHIHERECVLHIYEHERVMWPVKHIDAFDNDSLDFGALRSFPNCRPGLARDLQQQLFP